LNKIITGTFLLLIILFIGIFFPFFSAYKYDEIDLIQKNLPPSWIHPMGTDDLGRDLLTRMAFGFRISIFVGLTAAAVDCFIGVLWGSAAAFLGGIKGDTMMRFIDILTGIPQLLLVIVCVATFGGGIFTVVVSIAIFGWTSMARLARGQILEQMSQGYTLATLAIGGGYQTLLWRHYLPHIWPHLIVGFTMSIIGAIYTEAYLSFLGLGVQAPMASLGTMASEAFSSMRYYPWRLLFPAGGIVILILGLNLIVEGIKEKNA